MDDLKVGDSVDLGGFPYSTGMVVRVYDHPTCGRRVDVMRPYLLRVPGGPEVGVEKVDFLDPKRLKKVRSA